MIIVYMIYDLVTYIMDEGVKRDDIGKGESGE